MTSINTNVAAQTALRTLQSTNSQLDATQNRISTGLKIGSAQDNAAYWSISTTLKSDNKSLGTVKDALSLGAATIDTAYQGLNAARDVLDEIKNKIVLASGDSADKNALQAEISELQNQLKAIAGSSAFAGENWLSVDSRESNTAYSAEKSVVSSFDRDASGGVSLGTIGIDISKFSLIDADETSGILQAAITVEGGAGGTDGPAANTSTGGIGVLSVDATEDATSVASFSFADITLQPGEGLTFTVTVAGAETEITLTNDGEEAVPYTATTFAAALDAEKGSAAINITADGNGNILFTTTGTNVALAVSEVDLIAVDESGEGEEGEEGDAVNILNFNVSNATDAELAAYRDAVISALESVTGGAATLGAVASRVELQQTFVANLIDTIDRGISGLIDADLNEESTRLQALQVKQQLGVQALSIANQSAQNVLRLFQ